MKNILIVIAHLKHWWWAENSATWIWNELYKKWYNINYLTFYNVDKKYDFKWKEICLNEKFTKNLFLNFIKLFKRSKSITKLINKYNIDTILSFKEDSNIPNAFNNIFWRNNSKHILSIRGSIEEQNKLNKYLAKFLYPKADYITTIVKEETKNLIDNYWIKTEKVSNIYNMFDISQIQKKSKEDMWEYKELFNNWKFTFINIWRLSIQKNQKILLDAFDKFHKKNPNSQLIILWDGELKNELQNQANLLKANNNIHFLWVHENPYKFLKNSDCFVFSSAWEWFGRVLVEPMVCWTPVISTDCPVWPKEILKKDIKNFEEVKNLSKEEYGILVPNKNMEKLSKAMELVYNDKSLRENYSLKSLERCKDFDIDNIIWEWENIL